MLIGRQRRSHDKPQRIGRRNCVQQTDLRVDRLAQAVAAHVADDADNLKPVAVRAVEPAVGTDRVLMRPVARRGGLIDDDVDRVLMRVRFRKQPAGDERNPHRAEVAGTDHKVDRPLLHFAGRDTSFRINRDAEATAGQRQPTG